MRAEELWLVGASPWFAAIWISNDWPTWIAVAVCVMCLTMTIAIYRKRKAR